jgi:hypothetical protein
MSVTAGRVTDHVAVGTAVQITAATVLLQEGVEGGEELGHGNYHGQPLEAARPLGRMPGALDQTGTKRKSYLVVNSLLSSASFVST